MKAQADLPATNSTVRPPAHYHYCTDHYYCVLTTTTMYWLLLMCTDHYYYVLTTTTVYWWPLLLHVCTDLLAELVKPVWVELQAVVGPECVHLHAQLITQSQHPLWPVQEAGGGQGQEVSGGGGGGGGRRLGQCLHAVWDDAEQRLRQRETIQEADPES